MLEGENCNTDEGGSGNLGSLSNDPCGLQIHSLYGATVIKPGRTPRFFPTLLNFEKAQSRTEAICYINFGYLQTIFRDYVIPKTKKNFKKSGNEKLILGLKFAPVWFLTQHKNSNSMIKISTMLNFFFPFLSVHFIFSLECDFMYSEMLTNVLFTFSYIFSCIKCTCTSIKKLTDRKTFQF